MGENGRIETQSTPRPNGELWQRPVELLQALLRFDTSNPPGHERACLEYVGGILEAAGVEPVFYARDPERPNLVARLQGRGEAPPLLLYGHVDVVPAAGSAWRHPPFTGELVDGEIWGRGALDMKGGVAMLLAALLRVRHERFTPAGDVILVLHSDEETGSEFGARFLIENHADLFTGVRHAISEAGGFTQHIGGRRFYPIQVAEKQSCRLKVTLRGSGGHGSMPPRHTAAARLGQLLVALDRKQLPAHLTPATRRMLGPVADGLPVHQRLALRALLVPGLTGTMLKLLRGEASSLGPLVQNTAAATIISGGESWNVIPTEASAELDGRLLPGQRPEDLVAELKRLLPEGAEVEIVQTGPPAAGEPDLALLPLLAAILKEADPDARPFPMLSPGITDARFYASLGIQTYGFLPMRLPPHISFGLIHSRDERVTAAAIEFGADALHQLLHRYGPELGGHEERAAPSTNDGSPSVSDASVS